jgi:hypothetical protein
MFKLAKVEIASGTVAAPAGSCADCGVTRSAALQAFSAATGTALRNGIHLTPTYRKTIDELRRISCGNIMNKIPVLQNEPKALDLSALNATPDANGDFHRTHRTHGSPDSPPGIHL